MYKQANLIESHTYIWPLSILLILSILLFYVPVLNAEERTGASSDKTLVIATIDNSPEKQIKALQPMADYLVMHMQDLGYSKGMVFVARNKQELQRALQRNDVDLVTETAFTTMYLNNKTGLQPILRKWKKGIAEYHAVIFVRKDSEINTLQDLQGKSIAFEDATSTSAYYLPAYELLMAGLKLEQLNSPRDNTHAEFIGYVFSTDEINTSVWVHKGRVDAGAISNLDWEDNDKMPSSFIPDLKIIHTSISLPRAIESLRKTLPDEVKTRITTLLLNIHNDENGYGVLQAYDKTRKFDLLSEQTWDSLNKVNHLLRAVDEAAQ